MSLQSPCRTVIIIVIIISNNIGEMSSDGGSVVAGVEEEQKQVEQKENSVSSKKADDHHHSSSSSLPACCSFTAAAENRTSSSSTSSPTPHLVLLFAWMLAKEAHLEKYRTFWASRGYDVLTVRTGPLDTLLPTVFAARNARRLIDFLEGKGGKKSSSDDLQQAASSPQPRYSRVLFHSLSVGNYVAQEVLYQLRNNSSEGNRHSAAVHASIGGCIMDSITFLEDSAAGIARSLTTSWLLQLTIRTLINGYFVLTAPFTWSHFHKVIPVFTENPGRLPTLVLYSLDDPLSDWRRIKTAIEAWKAKGITVHERCWHRSQHVLHYKLHPGEYTEAVEEFLDKGVGV